MRGPPAVGDFISLPFFDYQYGVPKGGSDGNTWLAAQYNDWKAHYVVDVDSEQAKVVRDNATHNDTVSEGIAYGMLLAVYFNDRPTFDKLFNYAKASTTTTATSPGCSACST
jgi:endo-1,4-beta-D-glucanase Y